MGRVSFGGNQDLSQLFSALYAQYENRLENLADRAARRADEEQAAIDADTIDRWQQGELTDAEFLAYAEQRIAETSEDDDPGQNAYWKRVLRDAEKSILSEQISDTAEDIIDKIQAGKASWSDLKRFYQQQRRKLRPSDPVYKQLSDQIEEIDDRIAQNKVDGAFARVDYQFRNGSITGSQAGAQLRQLAQQYRQNDPARYWQILAQAADLERHGGFYGSGGGSGGRSSGGSASRSANLNALIDALEGQDYRLETIYKQFESGATTGQFTYETEDGRVVTEEVLLRNPDGTPSQAMQSLTDAKLTGHDRLIASYKALAQAGDSDAERAWGLEIQQKSDFITNHVQPLNTIAPEMQGEHLLSALHEAIEAAGNSDDPVLAWSKVKQVASQIDKWYGKLNTDLLNTTPGIRGGVQEGVETTPTEYRKASAVEDQTTPEFAQRAASLNQWAQAIANASSAEEIVALSGLAEGLVGPEQAGALVEQTRAVVDIIAGIASGQRVRVFVPGQGLVWAPLGQTVTTVMGPTGPQPQVATVPVDAKGNALWDGEATQGHLIFAEINGRVEPVWAVSESSHFIGNRPVDKQEFDAYQRRLMSADGDEKELAELAAEFGTNDPGVQYRQMLIPRKEGGSTAWYFDPTAKDGQGAWFKNRVTKYGGVPVPFAGVNGRKAQQMADTLGVDPSGRAYFNATVVNAREKQAFREGDDWYRSTQEAARREHNQQQRQQLAQSFVTERFAQSDPRSSTPDIMRGPDSRIGNIIARTAKQVGISLTPPTRGSDPVSRLPKGLGSSRFGLTEVNVPPVNVTRPRITLPQINIPRISMNPTSSTRSQLQTGNNLTEGFGNDRFRLP